MTQERPEDRARPDREIADELRLRPEAPRVVRLSRRVLGLIAGVSALAIGGALIWALQSNQTTAPAELYNTENRPPAEGLARLPRDYAGVPRDVPALGPPLPGDLGRPMLNAGVEPGPMPGAPGVSSGPAPDPEAQRIAHERQLLAQERDSARSSRLFAAEAGTAASAISAQREVAQVGLPMPMEGAINPSGQPAPPAETDRRRAFLASAVDRRTVSAERVEAPASPFMLQAGAVIPAAMITGLRSDLPGQIMAQVTQNVYDSATGRTLLIPQGSRLIGEYDAEVTFGQNRALLVWTRLIMPNGKSLVLERLPGADAAGYAGLQDRVDNHWAQILRAALVSTVLAVGSGSGSSEGDDELVRAIRQGTSNSISQTGRQIVGQSLSIQPTLTIRPGFPVRVIVTQDLVFEPYRD